MSYRESQGSSGGWGAAGFSFRNATFEKQGDISKEWVDQSSLRN